LIQSINLDNFNFADLINEGTSRKDIKKWAQANNFIKNIEEMINKKEEKKDELKAAKKEKRDVVNLETEIEVLEKEIEKADKDNDDILVVFEALVAVLQPVYEEEIQDLIKSSAEISLKCACNGLNSVAKMYHALEGAAPNTKKLM